MIVRKKDRVDFFQSLLKKSESGRDKAFDEIKKNRDQYDGTRHVEGGQDVKVVRNITYELLESQVSTVIPAPRVDAKMWSERNERCAKSVEQLCQMLRNQLPFERMNDEDERNTYVDGGSAFFVEWDESIREHGACGGLRVTSIAVDDLFPQPGIFTIDDMDWFILRFQSTKEEIQNKYGVTPAVAEEAENDASVEEADEDTCTVYVCFYKNEDGCISQFIWSGATVLADIEDYYARKRYICSRCGKRRELCESYERCDCGADFVLENEEYEELTRDVQLSDGTVVPARTAKFNPDGTPVTKKVTKIRAGADGAPMVDEIDGVRIPLTEEVEEGVMEQTHLPWYRPKHFPVVVRKNTARRKSLLGQSDCEFIRPQQEEINKIESRIHGKIFGSGSYPFKPEEVEFEFDSEVQTYVLNIPQGHSRAEFGVLDLMPSLQQEQLQSDRCYEHAKKILGITASYQGQEDNTAKSGIAKQAQIAQAAGRLSSKRVMKNAAYADLDRVIFELYLAYADEPRPLAFVDSFGRMQNSAFNRYDFIRYDEETHEYYYEDRFLFSVDQNGGADTQREVLWQLNLQNFQAGVYGNPQEPATLLRYWQMQERAHYPFARENVEYFTALMSAKQEAVQANQMNGGMSDAQ